MGPWKSRLGGCVHRLIGREVVVEGLEGGEEACFSSAPCERCRVVPALASLHRTERPVEEVPHVSENLDRLATSPSNVAKVSGAPSRARAAR